MNQLWQEDTFDIERSPISAWEARVRRWLWPLLGFSAWVVFELTSELWASTLVLCTHYAWVPLSTGCWLWWNDPSGHRGRCSLLAFAGHALGRMVLAGILIVVFLSPLAFQNPAIERAVFAAAIVYVIGLLMMVILIWLALFLARIQGVRLWVNSHVHRSARGVWPPTQTGRGNRIHIGFWVASCLGVPAFAAGIFMPMVVRIQNPGQQHLATITVFLGSYVFVAAFYCWFARHAMARYPAECWPHDQTAGSHPYTNQMRRFETLQDRQDSR